MHNTCQLMCSGAQHLPCDGALQVRSTCCRELYWCYSSQNPPVGKAVRQNVPYQLFAVLPGNGNTGEAMRIGRNFYANSGCIQDGGGVYPLPQKTRQHSTYNLLNKNLYSTDCLSGFSGTLLYTLAVTSRILSPGAGCSLNLVRYGQNREQDAPISICNGI